MTLVGTGRETDQETPQFRPSLHFTPQATWMNDPNGLITHKGVHHMFFQNNPYGRVWGNMSWGHAVSSDFLSWTELPVAITGSPAEGIFSGSVVWDRSNTSGLGRPGDEGPLVAIYTSAYTELSDRPHEQAQSLAWSVDDGMTWHKYPGNPILSRGSRNFRDPKVFWHEATRRWVMTCVEALERQVIIHTSANLLEWELASTFGPSGAREGIWECPDLLQVPVEGTDEKRWVLLVSLNPGGPCGGSGMQWFLGDFDGTSFTCDADEPPVRWFDQGPDMYAAVSFANTPGVPRVLGWLSNWSYARESPTHPWASSMTLVRELTLVSAGDDLQLRHRPVLPINANKVAVGSNGRLPEKSAYVVSATLPDTAATLTFARHGDHESTSITVARRDGQLVVGRDEGSVTDLHVGFERTRAIELPDGPVEMRVVEDHGLFEIFLDGGLLTVTLQTFPADGPLHVTASGVDFTVEGYDQS